MSLSLLSSPAFSADELPELSDRTAEVLVGLPNDDSVKTLEVGDFDQDGLSDILIARRENTPILLMNEGGVLVNRTSEFLENSVSADNSTYVQSFDANNDGFSDVIFAVLDQPVYLYLNMGNQNGQWQGFDAGVEIAGATNALTIESGDITGDGTADDLLVNQVMANNVLLLNDGAGNFTNASAQLDTLETLVAGHFSLVNDANADGVDDIMHIEADDNLFVYYNDGFGNFSHGRRKSFQNTNFGQPLAYTCGCADYNGDGIYDFAVLADGGGNDRLTSFMSTGVISAQGIPEHVFVDQPGVPMRLSRRHGLGHNGDIDGDGDLDFVQSSLERVHGTLDLRPIGVRTLIVINTGINSGIFEGYSEGDWAIEDSHDMKFIDINADGNLDLFVGHDTRYGAYINAAPPSNIVIEDSIVATPTETGDNISIEATLLTGSADSFLWEFGDGTSTTTTVPNVQHVYDTAGRYTITLTATGPNGSDQINFKQSIHNALTANSPLSSSGMVYESTDIALQDLVYVANPDNNSVSALSAFSGLLQKVIAVGTDPRSLALGEENRLYVVNKGNAELTIINTDTAEVIASHKLPYASRPHGIVIDTQQNHAFIALEARNEIIKWDLSTSEVIATLSTGIAPRALALSADRTSLYAPLFITQPMPGESTRVVGETPGAQLLVIDAQTLNLTRVMFLGVNNLSEEEEDSDISSRGLPNYLRAPAISPDGLSAIVPAKIDNIYRGLMRDGRARAHDKLVRGTVIKFDTQANIELLDERIDFDNNSAPSAVAYNNTGNLMFVIHEGSRAFEILDAHTNAEIFRTTIEFAPRSIVVSPNGERVYIHNYLSRSVSLFDVKAIAAGTSSTAELISVNSVVTSEQLSEEVLRGKQLFHDSEDNRLSTQGYISCASCHDDGGHDGRTWDFSDAGEGLRNTIDLRGRAAIGNGNVHWSANFDEFQDFENDIREIFDGTGLMSDADFAASAAPLDILNPKSGKSSDLDALAAYGASLKTYHQSPYRQSNGELTAAGELGKAVYKQADCAACHLGTDFTDSPAGVTHDIGTIDVNTGGRLGMPLLNGGLDTPTLRGLWDGAPYLHNGSANTLQDAVWAHTKNSTVDISTLSSAELDHLASYLLQIDGNELTAPVKPTEGTTTTPLTNAQSNEVNTGDNDVLSVVDGSLRDWNGLSNFALDSTDTFDADNTLDIVLAQMAHDSTQLYVRYRTKNSTVDTWGISVHFDSDNNPSTGFKGFNEELPVGIDYMIEGQNLYQYSGNGTNFSWVALQSLENTIIATSRELKVPRLGLGNPVDMRLFFYANNEAVGGSVVDVYPDSVAVDGVDLESRSFAYTLGQAIQVTPPTNVPSDALTISNPVTNISLDGLLADWSSLESFGIDGDDVNGSDNKIDWLEAWMAHNISDLFIAWTNDGESTVSWGNGIMLDTDQNSQTGYVGYQDNLPIGIDFLIEDVSIYRYTGLGSDWSWDYAGEARVKTILDKVEMSISRDILGPLTDIDLFFIGNNAAVGGLAIDYYPDGVSNNTLDRSARHVSYSTLSQSASGSDINRSIGIDSTKTYAQLSNSGVGSMSPLWLLSLLILVLCSGLRKVQHLVQLKSMTLMLARSLAMLGVLFLTACGDVNKTTDVSGNGAAAPINIPTGGNAQPQNNPSLPGSVQLGAAVSSPEFTVELSGLRLSGALTIPPTPTRGQGIATVEFNTVSGIISGQIRHNITDATGASIHLGPAGQNGQAVLSLEVVDLNEFKIATGSVLSKESIAAYNAGELYVVVSSNSFPSGEIRAQLSSAPVVTNVQANLDDIQAKVFSPTCSGCHLGGGSTLPSSMDLTSAERSYNSLINNDSKQEPSKVRILPGQADASYLVDKIEGRQVVGSHMPFRGVALDVETINAIRTWIDSGAEQFSVAQ